MAQYTDLFTRKAYFELLEHQEIDKPARDAYWKLLHRCHIPVVKKLSYQHPVFTLQISLYHFEQECLTPSKQFSDAQESATRFWHCVNFLTIIALRAYTLTWNLAEIVP